MPFQTLLFDSLLPGSSYGEQGTRVSVKQESGETVLFFRLDQPFHEKKGLRRYLKQDQPVSDILVFYRRNQEAVPRLCLVELKGGDLDHALDQLRATHQVLESHLKTMEVGRGNRPQVEWRGIVRMSGASPRSVDKRKLTSDFDKCIRVTREDDIGIHLRK